MISHECANFRALEIADNLRKDIWEMSTDLLNVWVQCYPAFPAELTVTIDTLDPDCVSVDYLKWLPKRAVKRISNEDRPCFFSSAIRDLLARAEARIQYYGGIRDNSGKESQGDGFYFIYHGPFVNDSDLPVCIRFAAKKLGMTGTTFMKFWRRHSWKIKDDIRQYTDAVMFDFWFCG